MINFKRFIENYTEIPDSDWQIITQVFEIREYVKNDSLLEEGSVCRYFYFLEHGLIRFFHYINGEDLTRTFCIAPYCFTSKASFRKQVAADENIQVLEKSVIWRVNYENYQKLLQLNSWNVFIRKLLGEIQEFAEEMFLEAKTETAEIRYLKLLDRYPVALIQRIPLKHISSYLGIAPQSLSRIRKKIHQERKS